LKQNQIIWSKKQGDLDQESRSGAGIHGPAKLVQNILSDKRGKEVLRRISKVES